MDGLAYLLISIVAEVIATTSLKASDCFTRLLPSIIVVIGYSISFFGYHKYSQNDAIRHCLRYLVWFRDRAGVCGSVVSLSAKITLASHFRYFVDYFWSFSY